MDSGTILQDLSSTIDKSRHKNLILSGISVLSNFLNKEEIDLSIMKEPFRDSVKILADDIEEEISYQPITYSQENTVNLENDELYILKKYAGKYIKKELLKSVGEKFSDEEKLEYEQNKKRIVELLIDYL